MELIKPESSNRIHADYKIKLLILLGLKDLLAIFFGIVFLYFSADILENFLDISSLKLNIALYIILLLISLIVFSAVNTWYYHRYIELFSFEITDFSINIYSGVFTRKLVIIPYSRIQNINVKQDILDRHFHLYTLEIETAGAPVVINEKQAAMAEGFISGNKDPNVIITAIRKGMRAHSSSDPNVENIFFHNPDIALDHFVSIFLEKMKEGKDINNKIKDLRVSKNITQQDLAEKVGVSRQTIVQLEKGEYNPSLKLAFRIAAVLGVSIEKIFEATGDDLDPTKK